MSEIEQLEGAARAVADAAKALADASGRFVTRRVFYACMAAVLVAMVALGVVVRDNRHLVTEGREQTMALTRNAELLTAQTDLLTECTTPDPDPGDDDPHECWDRAQASQAAAVEQLNTNFAQLVDRTVSRVLALLRAAGVDVPATG